MARVLIPLPDRDFDVTEVSVPWKLLTEAGHDVSFATERGDEPAADPLLLSGVVFGQLGADDEPKGFYAALRRAPAFERPVAWRDIDVSAYGALILPGGHAPGMRQYLEGVELFAKVAAFARTGKPIAAICHGVVVLARAKDPQTGKSPIAARRTTCLPKYMERSAWLATAWKVGRYYRTYDTYVEDEVRAALDDAPVQFQRGPRVLFRRGTREDDAPAFVVEDDNYVSARWPGDAYLFAKRILARL
jgi:putative intracellular protease/amidase